jgi:hypothetical protein
MNLLLWQLLVIPEIPFPVCSTQLIFQYREGIVIVQQFYKVVFYGIAKTQYFESARRFGFPVVTVYFFF